MNPNPSPPIENASKEITALIDVLRETEQRLENLTGGEIDAVADRDGRIFLLRRAQDELRYSEAAKQVAILDALPANIALLDTRGSITSVNEAWQRFAAANTLTGPRHGAITDAFVETDDAPLYEAIDAGRECYSHPAGKPCRR